MDRPWPTLLKNARLLGLTKLGRERGYNSRPLSEKMKLWHTLNEHPRGFKGHKHTTSALEKISRASTAHWDTLNEDQKSEKTLRMLRSRLKKHGSLAPPRFGVSWKGGWRTIGGKRSFYRSAWEANYARYLEWLRCRGDITDWKHEPKTFWFEKIKRGTRSYLPDFLVVENDGSEIYHEVKGWMDDRSKTKLKRMAIYHPEIKVVLIASRSYASISKQLGSLIPEWESGDQAEVAQANFLTELAGGTVRLTAEQVRQYKQRGLL